MGTLISNGSSLYRYNSSLLRTPITFVLRPKQVFVAPAGQSKRYTYPGGVFDVFCGAVRDYDWSDSNSVFNATYESQYEEIYASTVHPSSGWIGASFDPGACYIAGAFSPTDPIENFLGSGLYLNDVASSLIQQACYRFEIPKCKNALVSYCTCHFAGSSALSFGSVVNGEIQRTTGEFPFFGLINGSYAVSPSALMSELNGTGTDFSFMISSGSSLSRFDYFRFPNALHVDGRGEVPAAWMSGTANPTTKALDKIQDIVDRESTELFLHIVSPFAFTGTGLGFEPEYVLESPFGFVAQICRDPVLELTII